MEQTGIIEEKFALESSKTIGIDAKYSEIIN